MHVTNLSKFCDPIGLYRDVWITAIACHNADYVPYAKIRFDL